MEQLYRWVKRWIRTSERLPTIETNYRIRVDGKNPGFRYIDKKGESLSHLGDNVEWEEAIKLSQLEIIKEICVNFFYYWFNRPGNNTREGFDEWAKTDNGKEFLSWLEAITGESEDVNYWKQLAEAAIAVIEWDDSESTIQQYDNTYEKYQQLKQIKRTVE